MPLSIPELNAFYLSFYRRLVMHAAKFLDDRDDAHDVAQEVLLAFDRQYGGQNPRRVYVDGRVCFICYKNLRTAKLVEDIFGNLLYGMCEKTALYYRRSRRNVKARERRYTLEWLTDVIIPTPQDNSISADRKRRLSKFIDALSEADRKLLATYLEERSFAKTARASGLSESTVRRSIGAIMAVLRNKFTL